MSRQPQHYAFVASSDPLEVPREVKDAKPTASDNTQDSLVALYQSYAERFPNPRLIEEYQERDQLLQATSAAHSAASRTQQQQQANQNSSWLGFLFGGGSKQNTKRPARLAAYAPPSSEEEEWLTYTEVQDEAEALDEALCGTNHSLDRSCIPQDAHSMARLLLASERTRGERPHVVRSSPFLPEDCTLCIVGLGMIADWKIHPDGGEPTASNLATTSDRDDLLAFAEHRRFDLSMVRAVCFGPNCLLVSWGFNDGVVVFYRRIDLPDSSIAWEAVVFLGPSQAVLEHSFDLFAEDDDNPEDAAGSDLLRVTDMVPLVLSTPGMPAAALAVSRLGGYMEILPLPLSLWNGPPFPSERHRPRKNTKNRGHYAKKKMVNVAADHVPIPILAVTTMEYHVDILCLEAIRTRKRIDAVWDREFYTKSPPAEYILVASGCSPQGGHEILTFWAISYVFIDEPPNADSAGFTLTAILQEALDVDSMGAELSIFANREILNQWRQPRKVALKEKRPPPALDEDGEPLPQRTDASLDTIFDDNTPPTSVYDRVTTITTSAPIIAMNAIVIPTGVDEIGVPTFVVMLSLLDWNGSVTIMDCSLFERMTSHHLSDDEYRIIYGAEIAAAEGQDPPEPPPDVALVKTVVDRSRTMKFMKSGQTSRNAVKCMGVQWLARESDPADPWLIFLTSARQGDLDKNHIMILSGLLEMDGDNPKPLMQSVPFPTATATLQGSPTTLVPGNFFSPALRIVFSPKREMCGLSICLLQPLLPRDIILSLSRDGKYKKAIEAALQLGSEEEKHVTIIVEECRQKLWEQTWDLQWLQQVSNDSYIIQQALALFTPDTEERDEGEEKRGGGEGSDNRLLLESMDIEMCRGICVLALQRTSRIRLPSAVALGRGGKENLQSLVARLGTYELLCQALDVESSFSKFRETFIGAPVVELAKSFASSANLAALSILWFRHSKDLKSSWYDILNLLPLTLNPKNYCFLLPMGPQTQENDPDGTSLFITTVPPCDGECLLHVSQFPSFLKSKLGFNVVLNVNDEKMVLELNSNATVATTLVEHLPTFYQSRATVMQRFVSNLEDIADFCAIGLLALGASPEALDTNPPSLPSEQDEHATHTLFCTWGCARSLERMLEESVGDSSISGVEGELLDLSPFATVTPLDLWAMKLADIVAMVLGGQDDPVTIYEIYKQHLVPLLKYLPETQNMNLDQAICTYCIDLVKGSICEKKIINGEDKSLLEAAKTCAAVACGSRTSMKKSDRIVKDKCVLIDLALDAILEVSEKCKDQEIDAFRCSTLVKLIWDMYESLPIGASKASSHDYTVHSGKADNLLQDLVGLEILSQWPECQEPSFCFLADRQKVRRGKASFEESREKQGTIFQKALSSLCRSFCFQAKAKKGSLGLASLLRDLISDIEQIFEVCYNRDETLLHVLVSVLSSELIAPLSRQADFELVAQLLTAIDKTWRDEEQEARTVRSYVENIVFSDSENQPRAEGDHSLQAAITCQDALGPVFPELQDGFQLSRRYLDAAHFINTVIFTELKMPKTIKPNDLRGELPLDIVESILKAIPTAIVIRCKEWEQEHLAIHANKALRSFQESAAGFHEPVDTSNLPPIPGGAIFHLAGIFGLEDASSVLVVKSRVVHYGMKGGFFGAAAAICRTILSEPNAFVSEADSLARVAAVAEVVTRKDYEDNETKKELCLDALRRYDCSTSINTCKQIDSILNAYTSLEVRANQARQSKDKSQILNLPPTSDSIGCLYKDSWGQYSVNVYDLFWNLQQQSAGCLIDDALLNALSRYVFFSCIFRSTRPRTAHAGKLEKATTNELLVFGAAILLHINQSTNISTPAIKELQSIVEQQTMAVINQHPTAFQDPFTLADETIVRQLVAKGFPPLAARRSALATKNAGFQQALQWGIQNARDPRMNDPIVLVTSPRRVFAEKANIQQILNTFSFTQQFLSGQRSVQEWILDRPTSLCGNGDVASQQEGQPGQPQKQRVLTLDASEASMATGANSADASAPAPAPTAPQRITKEAVEVSKPGSNPAKASSEDSGIEPEREAPAKPVRPPPSAPKPQPPAPTAPPEQKPVVPDPKQQTTPASLKPPTPLPSQPQPPVPEPLPKVTDPAPKPSAVATAPDPKPNATASESKPHVRIQPQPPVAPPSEPKPLQSSPAVSESQVKVPEPKLQVKPPEPKLQVKPAEPKLEVKHPEPKQQVKPPPKLQVTPPEPKLQVKPSDPDPPQAEPVELKPCSSLHAQFKAPVDGQKQTAAQKQPVTTAPVATSPGTAPKSLNPTRPPPPLNNEVSTDHKLDTPKSKEQPTKTNEAKNGLKDKQSNGTLSSASVNSLAKPPQPSGVPPIGKSGNGSSAVPAPAPRLNINTERPSKTAQTASTSNRAGPNSASNTFITPTNRPTTLRTGLSTGNSSTASDRSALKQRGEAAMQAVRSTPRSNEQNQEERKRLIEAGRRLLAKSRPSAGNKPSGSSSVGNKKPFPASTSSSKSTSFGSSLKPLGTSSTPQPSGRLTSKVASAPKSSAPIAKAPPPPKAPSEKATKLETDNDDSWGFDDETEKVGVSRGRQAPVPSVLKPSVAPPPHQPTVAPPVPARSPAPSFWGAVTALVAPDPPRAEVKAPPPAPPAKAPAPAISLVKPPAQSFTVAPMAKQSAPKAPAPPLSDATTASKPASKAPVPSSVGPFASKQASKAPAPPMVAHLAQNPPAPADGSFPTIGQVSASQLDVSESQGGWDDFDDDLGDIEGGSEHPVEPSATPAALLPASANLAASVAAPVLAGAADPEVSESQGGWDDFNDDDLGDIEGGSEHPAAPPVAPAPSPPVAHPVAPQLAAAPLVPASTKLATKLPAPAAPVAAAVLPCTGPRADPDVSESQGGGWDFDTDDLGDIEDTAVPQASAPAPLALAKFPTQVPPPAAVPSAGAGVGGEVPHLDVSESQVGWGFDGDDDLGDIEDGPGNNEGSGFDDESGHPAAGSVQPAIPAAGIEGAAPVVTNLDLDEGEGEGWDDDEWGFDD